MKTKIKVNSTKIRNTSSCKDVSSSHFCFYVVLTFVEIFLTFLLPQYFCL